MSANGSIDCYKCLNSSSLRGQVVRGTLATDKLLKDSVALEPGMELIVD